MIVHHTETQRGYSAMVCLYRKAWDMKIIILQDLYKMHEKCKQPNTFLNLPINNSQQICGHVCLIIELCTLLTLYILFKESFFKHKVFLSVLDK